jgi:transcription elongation factor Elf1
MKRMRIKKIESQNRRDFYAVYECEGCGHTEKSSGYDDRNFHDNVIPNLVCAKCNKSRNDLGIEGEEIQTKYPEGMEI